MREGYIAAVQAHLDRVAQSGDPGQALAPGVRDDIRRLVEAVGDEEDIEVAFVLGWLHWYRYLALPDGQDRDELRAAIHALLSCFLDGVEPIPDQLMPVLADIAAPMAVEMLRDAMTMDGPEPVQAAVAVLERVVTSISADDPKWPGHLSNLGVALQILFERTGLPAHMDAAVEVLQHAAAAIPADDAGQAEQWHRLGRALLDRYEHAGERADLDSAVEAARLAAEADLANATYQWLLGKALRVRFEVAGMTSDLDRCIEADRRAVAAVAPGHRDHAGYSANLGFALNLRFGRSGADADLDEAIAVFEQASDLYNLGVALTTRFSRTGVPADLDMAISAYRQVAQVPGPPVWQQALNNLGIALRMRFDRTSDRADLDDAIQTGQLALTATPASDPGRGVALANLCVPLLARFAQTGDRADLAAAVDLAREAVEVTPPGHPQRAHMLNNLGLALQRRFEAYGNASDIEEAARIAQQAVDATPAEAPERPGRVMNLALALRIRFENTRATADLSASVQLAHEAVDATPAGHPERAVFQSDLGTTLHVSYRRTSVLSDLDAAIGAFQDAVDTLPAQRPFRAGVLHNLSVALRDRYANSENPVDLDAAVDASREAVAATPTGATSRPAILSTLSEAYCDRFERAGDPADLDAAIAAARQAVAETPDHSPDRAVHLACLGNCLQHRADLAQEAADAYTAAVQDSTGDAGIRISAARAAATLSWKSRPEVAAELMETAVGLLPEAASRGAGWDDRLHEVSHFARLADEAASLTLSVSGTSPLRALTLLESGRMILLGTAPAGTETVTPLSPADLAHAAESGPVAVFNISRYRSDALLLIAGGINCLPLPDLTADTLVQRFLGFRSAIGTVDDPDAGWQERVEAQNEISSTLEWLWDVAAEPVLRSLGLDKADAGTGGSLRQRIWWVPGGMLSLFPLHAAGYHRARDGRTVMDRVVSSYALTVRMLLLGRQMPESPTAAGGSLVVAMPSTPGERALPNAASEAALLRDRLPDPVILTEPAKDAVLTALGGQRFVHFACHGVSDPLDPSRSRLLLRDHDRTPLTVAELATGGLAGTSLVYLSACATANMNVISLGEVEIYPRQILDDVPSMADFMAAIDRTRELLGESIHLAAALHGIGVRHVVGTLWEISDALALEITDAFYAGLRTESGALDTDQSAEALHRAVLSLRNRMPGTPSLWAPYLHIGA